MSANSSPMPSPKICGAAWISAPMFRPRAFDPDIARQRISARPASLYWRARALRARLIDENDRLRGLARASYPTAEPILSAAIAADLPDEPATPAPPPAPASPLPRPPQL